MPSPRHVNPWLKCRQENPRESARLLCFPYAGASAVIYHAWFDALGPAIGVCPVQLPGRAERLHAPPLARLSDLLPLLDQALRIQPDRPLAFFGHSMGAILAFELARTFAASGGPVVSHLFVSGRDAPSYPFKGPFLSHLSDAEFKEGLCELKGTPLQILENDELFQLLLPALRADFALVESYRFQPGPPLDCPITVFAGYDDPTIERARLQAWGDFTTGQMTLHILPGDHFFINTARSELLAIIAAALSGSPAAR